MKYYNQKKSVNRNRNLPPAEIMDLAEKNLRTVTINIIKYTQGFQGKHEHYRERNGRQKI